MRSYDELNFSDSIRISDGNVVGLGDYIGRTFRTDDDDDFPIIAICIHPVVGESYILAERPEGHNGNFEANGFPSPRAPWFTLEAMDATKRRRAWWVSPDCAYLVRRKGGQLDLFEEVR